MASALSVGGVVVDKVMLSALIGMHKPSQLHLICVTALLRQVILMPTTIDVSFTSKFTTISAALASLAGKVIAAPVTIQVASSASVYTMPKIDLSVLSNPGLVTIQGNITDPSHVQIITSDRGNAIYSAVSSGTATVQGFTFIASTAGTTYGVGTGPGGTIASAPFSLRLQGFVSCVAAFAFSRVLLPGLVCTGVTQFGIEAWDGAYVDAGSAQLSGVSGASTALHAANAGIIHVEDSIITGFPTTFDCSGGGFIDARGNAPVCSNPNSCTSNCAASGQGMLMPGP